MLAWSRQQVERIEAGRSLRRARRLARSGTTTSGREVAKAPFSCCIELDTVLLDLVLRSRVLPSRVLLDGILPNRVLLDRVVSRRVLAHELPTLEVHGQIRRVSGLELPRCDDPLRGAPMQFGPAWSWLVRCVGEVRLGPVCGVGHMQAVLVSGVAHR